MPSCAALAFNLIKSISEILIDMVLFFANVAFAIFEYLAISLFLDTEETKPPLSAVFKISISSFVSFMFFFILTVFILPPEADAPLAENIF